MYLTDNAVMLDDHEDEDIVICLNVMDYRPRHGVTSQRS